VQSKPWPHDAIIVKRAYNDKDEEERDRLLADALLLVRGEKARQSARAQNAHEAQAETTASNARERSE